MPTCGLCPRGCGANRSAERGYCGMPEQAVIARAALHRGEEPVISGTRGSGAIFFAGCALRCVYCQNYELSRGRVGAAVSAERLAEIFRELEDQGAHNLNLVNPTHFVPAILAAMDLYAPRVPVVWNSSGYELPETLRAMEGRVDVYLPDMKYVSPEVSGRLSAAPDYFRRASKALREMARQTGPVVIGADGMIRKGLIVRHLALPGHAEETRKALVWIRRALPEAWLSLMAQYTPCGEAAAYPPLDRPLDPEEYARAARLAESLGFEGFLQDTGASGTAEIPAFDLTGVFKARKDQAITPPPMHSSPK